MLHAVRVLAIFALSVGMLSVEAQAQPKPAESQTPQVPRCTRNVGTISIRNGDSAGWTRYQLQPPAGLLRVVVQQSGCFTIVERGAGLDAAMQERELSGSGNLQGGSNVGGGQIRAADYVMLADVIAQDRNAGGGAVGGALGGVVGGKLGGVIAGVGVREQTAQTTLTLANVRTTESFATEGNATNSNITWGGAGFLGGGAAGLGAYTDTEIGRVVTVAFIDAYKKRVGQLGALDASPAAATAPKQNYRTTKTAQLLARAGGGAVLRNLPVGAIVYPLGEREGLWWKVEDQNQNQGWINNDFLEPVK